MGDDWTYYSVDMGTFVCVGCLLAVFRGQEEEKVKASIELADISRQFRA